MNEINWDTIISNLSEAREQLQRIEARIAAGSPPEEEDLKICLAHAYHHLNFSWNARHVTTERYADMTDEDFVKWGIYPSDIETD